ncbi:MAG: 4-(cytidine 5'-diphospho)-2-C-methyl-D-erythritol kinase [Candidatus Coatesbacteria bacterium]
MLVRAPAKINLFLRVGSRRADGYHSIETLFHAIGLYDDLTLKPAKTLSFRATGIPSPSSSGNLVHRAAQLLRQETGCIRGAMIRLHKRIPLGAGLGGGSSDAAATLIGLNRLWHLGLSRKRLLALAARLGSDVPFFLQGGTAVGTGRGERLRPIPSRLRAWAVLLKPSFGVSTKDAYAALDRVKSRPRPSVSLGAIERAVHRGNLTALRVHNDFEAVVFRMHPSLARLKSSLLDAGATTAFMTGSGSTVVGLFIPGGQARRAARKSAGRGIWSAAAPLSR